MEAASFLWNATRGHRLTPWRSPYLLWRMETYTGRPADSIDAKFFFGTVWRERMQMLRFLRWIGELESHVSDRK
ncbi:hypothetical protein [Terriglobus saanensis]|uniref:Uncharacterized protein n=1 Tax=Terriglobus saanensis (strain ATCC BAA-1853 / DSM 23119 / SP1PR4) TaxID=401053 RepID=E8V5N8_TERSS|nr:hypothetical protein [Terriglobus saanensis]ADV82647.1 hypothetical protein AciPR4_1841 [Terriglobus saanensis SP1PR4]